VIARVVDWVRRRPRRCLAAFSLLLLLPGIGSRDLWNPDEPRYAEVAREMLVLDSYSVPHLNGVIYREKPPFHFWTIAAVGALRGGVDEVATRIPVALAAVAAGLAVFELGMLWFSPPTALASAAVFLGCGKILLQGRVGQIDMTLVALVAWAMVAWSYARLRDRPRWIYGFWLLAGIATTTKGFVGLLPPLLAIVLFLVLRGEWSALRRQRWGTGLLVYSLPLLAWLVPATLAVGPSYLEHLVLRQSVGRFANPWHHFRPWYYYLTVLPADFFPFSIVLPLALRDGWRRRLETHGATLFALCWVVVTVVFFSLSPGKRTVYILTMYPALALLVGDALVRGGSALRRWVSWPWLVVASLLATVALVAVTLPTQRLREQAVLLAPGQRMALGIAVGLMALGLLIGALRARRGDGFGSAIATGTGMAVAGTLLAALVLPALDPSKSLRPIGERLARELGPTESYLIVGQPLESAVLFYSRRFGQHITLAGDLEQAMAQGPHSLLVADTKDLAALGVTVSWPELAIPGSASSWQIYRRPPLAAEPPPR
jgi:4-amino-4-deoxy-L-arabinose transferase-like glycosyltransferase